MRPVKKLQLGKNGLSEAFLEQVKHLFKTERMIKIVMLKSACRDKKEAEKMAKEIIGILGKKFDYKLVGYVLTIVKYRKVQR